MKILFPCLLLSVLPDGLSKVKNSMEFLFLYKNLLE